tara:strand:+ start:536 stop:736 length:201 start_codon:yes stop_codon:yes gene_type:complete
MDLPIDDKELNTLVMIIEKVKGDGLGKRDVDAEKLYSKLKLVKEVRDENPDGPYKRILREKHGMVI